MLGLNVVSYEYDSIFTPAYYLRQSMHAASFESTRSRNMPREEAQIPKRTQTFQGLVQRRLKKFVDTWYGLQLAHYGGKYSIERMLAFEEYTRNTSINRVLLVVVGAPLVIIVLVLCQESIPLQNPAEGWQANYGFWVRAGLVGVGVGYAASIQICFWLDVPPLSMKQIMTYCGVVGAGYVAVGIVAAELWVFPIPFFMFILCSVTTPITLLFFRITVGPRAFQQILSQRERLRRLNRIGSLQAFMYVVYPAYQILFSHVNHTNYELPVLMILPVLRLMIKVVFASAATHKEDMIPAQVVFTVDFFDAIYWATFIRTVTPISLAVVMIVDLIQTATELYELHHQTQRILSGIHVMANNADEIDKNLLVAVRALGSSIELGQHGLNLDNIRVRSCIYHQVTDEGRTLLDKLERSSATRSAVTSYQHSLKTYSRIISRVSTVDSATKAGWIERCFRGRGTVKPQEKPAMQPNSQRKEDIPDNVFAQKFASARTRESKKLAILQEALEVLFTSECLILSEYLEIFVPTVYGVFVLAMVNLPSAQYHTELVGITRENVAGFVSRIFTYVLLEFASFTILAVIIQRNCGINALYQLAFVLEMQMQFVQSTLMMWILMTMTYRVVHFGRLMGIIVRTAVIFASSSVGFICKHNDSRATVFTM